MGAGGDTSGGAAIEVDRVVTRFGAHTIHDEVSFSIGRGELVAMIGGSGTGKSVLLREIIGLHRPQGGRVRLLGTDVWGASASELARVRRRFGMMFQEGALFSSLDVAANVATPIVEHTDIPRDMLAALVDLRLSLAGLDPGVGRKMPSELSGGMKKRAALARALALEPEVLFLDEPTSGLDPITARAFDRLLQFLCHDLGITVLVITHDLDTLLTIAERVIVLGGGKVVADGTIDQVMAVDDDWIREYFSVRTLVDGNAGARGARPRNGDRDGT
ncbi:MAG: ATP-binding cassette domain-containing protein [Burkholderiaceae bacterium]|nr:ATP-binding cassette domain-containing protein [Burkholderiaceae bacterium]